MPSADEAQVLLVELRELLEREPVLSGAVDLESADGLCAVGAALMRERRREPALLAFRAAVHKDPESARARHNLGSLWSELGEDESARIELQAAIRIDPKRAVSLGALAKVRQRQGDVDAACELLERATEVEPRAAWLHNLGICYELRGERLAAYKAFLRAGEQDPASLVSHIAAAELCVGHGELGAASEPLERATRACPDDPDVWANVVRLLQTCNFDERALEVLQQLLPRYPTHETLLLLLGNVLVRMRRLEEGGPYYERALALGAGPLVALQLARVRSRQLRFDEELELLRGIYSEATDIAEVGVQYALALQHAGRNGEAEAVLLDVLSRGPSADARTALAATRLAFGDADGALAQVRQADADPPAPNFNSALAIMVLNYCTDVSETEMLALHRKWAAHATREFKPWTLPPRDLDPDRRLKVGFVSGDFRAHSVSLFMEPLLAALSREQLAITCYSVAETEDAVTERIRAMDLTFVRLRQLTPLKCAKTVVADRPDILVDLCGWTADQRALLHVYKVAPIHVMYLGYPNTMGLESVDYQLTDALADPPGVEHQYVEELFRLPRCAWAFRPVGEQVEIKPKGDRPLRFGSFNNISKLSDKTLELWARVLAAVPESELFVKAKQLEEEVARDRLLARLAEHGVDVARVRLVAWSKSRWDHMELYGEVDIALDTFPYGGTTTTCEALWMGVPVITLVGTMPASRVGQSLLHAVGLPSLAVNTEEEYVARACDLARDPAALAELRRTLRDRMLGSALSDVSGLARAIESAFRTMWQRWVASQAAQGQS